MALGRTALVDSAGSGPTDTRAGAGEDAEHDEAYQHLVVEPLTGALGAEVGGVDLADVDDDVFAELHRAFLRHKVLFFRDQHISIDEHIAFGRRWGELEVHPFVRNDAGHPEVIILESTADKPNAAESWHTDVTFRGCPPLGSILRGRVIPRVGGDTVWANMELAYEKLPDEVKAQIDGKVATHSMEKVFGRSMKPEEREAALAEFPPQQHPVVRTHPETGRRALFVNRPFTIRIEGVEPEESRRLLDLLTAQVSVPQYQCRFRWRPDSFAMWDNRCTQHYAVPDFYPQHRRMERVTIIGDRPR
jgi:taurine dioxygenase